MEIVPETEGMNLASAIAKISQCMGIVEGLKPKQMEAIDQGKIRLFHYQLVMANLRSLPCYLYCLISYMVI